MRIICTEAEKEELLRTLTREPCLYADNDRVKCWYSGGMRMCRACIQWHIDFDIVKDGGSEE